MAEKNQQKSTFRVACTFATKCGFDQVQMDLKVQQGKKPEHDAVLAYLIGLHKAKRGITA